jgi:hypothetical protein
VGRRQRTAERRGKKVGDGRDEGSTTSCGGQGVVVAMRGKWEEEGWVRLAKLQDMFTPLQLRISHIRIMTGIFFFSTRTSSLAEHRFIHALIHHTDREWRFINFHTSSISWLYWIS